MADLGISIAAKLIEVIGSEIIKEICELWGYKSELEDLHKTVTTIKNVLLDAETKRELSHEQQGYISELKAAVYDADDLFDQFLTLAEIGQIDGNKVGKGLTHKDYPIIIFIERHSSCSNDDSQMLENAVYKEDFKN